MNFSILIPVALVMAVLFLVTKGVTGIVKPVSVDVQERIAFYAEQNGLPLALVKAVAKVESNFNPNAKNPLDPSYGLMQITPMLAEDYRLVNDWRNVTSLEIAKIMDINNNLDVACRHLSYLSKYGFSQMVQSYNVGEWGYKTGVRNRDYLDKVKRWYNEYTT